MITLVVNPETEAIQRQSSSMSGMLKRLAIYIQRPRPSNVAEIASVPR